MPSGIATFGERKKQEKRSYQKVLDFLSQTGYEILDVSENEEHFSDDIDMFFLDEKNKKLFSGEIKIDSRMGKTGNMFFEIYSNEAKQTPGCFLHSKADIWIYYDELHEVVFLFPLKKMKHWFLESTAFSQGEIYKNQSFFLRKSTRTNKQNGDFSHTTIGYILKTQQVEKSLTKNKISYIKKHIGEKITKKDIKSLK